METEDASLKEETEQTPVLDTLAERLGIVLKFEDSDTGLTYTADTATKRALCQALGYNGATETEAAFSLNRLRQAEAARFAPYVCVATLNTLNPFTLTLHVPASLQNASLSWVLTREDGSIQSGALSLAQGEILETLGTDKEPILRMRVSLALSAPLGYHDLSFLIGGEEPKTNARTRVIVAPEKCYLTPRLEEGGRVFGIPLQLYALSSGHNWGMGDLTDLGTFKTVLDAFGASFVGVNPLNALFADSPQDASPYFTSSRLFFNPLYIDTDAASEAVDSTAYTRYKSTPRFAELLEYAKQSPLVEYEYVAEMKYTALGFLFDTFKALHLTEKWEAKTARGKAFLDFCAQGGEILHKFALFGVLRSYFLSEGGSGDWRDWEESWRDADSLQVQAFAEQYKESVYFIKYQQFIAFEQMTRLKKQYDNQTEGKPVGLYLDLPVGASLNSAEVWSEQALFLQEVTVGAPPDLFNAAGQDWSLAAFNPIELEKHRYEPFVRLVSHMMRFARALRLDHAFFLKRLFLRVPGASGAYLRYPCAVLSALIALESHRNQCVVIAEDLGTAPPGFRDMMREKNMLSFRLFRYERQGEELKPPENYDRLCLVTTGSHDLPTWSAYWKGLDIELMRRLNLILPLQYEQNLTDRIAERQRLVRAFKNQGFSLAPDTVDDFPINQVPAWLMPNTYAYLGATNAMVVLMRLEDVLEQDEQINVPGTYLEYPNWRYKLPITLEKLLKDERILAMIDVMKRVRSLS